MKKFITLLTVICLSGSFLFGANGMNADGLITVTPSARAMALGDAYGACGNDVQAMYFNPAGLGLIKWPEASASYLEFTEGVRSIGVAYAHPLKKLGAIAGEFSYFMTGGLAEIDGFQETGTTLSASDLLVQAGWGLSPVKNLFLGLSARMYGQLHLEETGISINFNLGALYAFQFLSIGQYQRRNFGIGVSVQNLGSKVSSGTVKNPLPMNIKTGIYYRPRSILQFAFDFNYQLNSGVNCGTGLEIMPDWWVSPRIGYKFGIPGNEGLTAGLGVNVRKDPIKIRADYAILPMYELGMQHYVTLTANFGVKKTWEEVEDEKLAQEYAKQKKEEKQAELAELRAEMQKGLTIAVNDFSAKGVSEVEAAMVSDYLRSFLVKTKKFRVIDKGNMEMILKEQEFQASGCTDAECAVEIGQLLGARLMVAGSFGQMMGNYIISISVADVETSQIFLSDTVKCKSFGDIEDAVEKLAQQIAEKAAVFETE